MRNEAEVNRVLDLHADTVRRICFMHLKSYSDTEDVFQDVFLKYILSEQIFESDEHEKAWLIRTAVNRCKDVLKSFFRKKVISVEELTSEPFYLEENDKELLDTVFSLPEKYRDVIYLFYYEGYTAAEIGSILNKNENTVYTQLSRARKALKEQLGGELFE